MSKNRLALNSVLLSIVVIPLLKILMGLFILEHPIYLVPFLLTSLFYIFTNLHQLLSDNRFKLLNGVILVFIIKSIFWDNIIVDNISIKYLGSYLLIPNLILSLFIYEKNEHDEILLTFFKYLKASGLILSVLVSTSLLLFYIKGVRFDFIQMFSFENFFRTSIQFRENNLFVLNILNHINPGIISDRLNRGPQAIIINFCYLFLLITFWDKIRRNFWDYLLLGLSIFILLLINSRAMLLTLIVLICFKLISRKIHLKFLRPLFFVSVFFPFLLLILKDTFLNGRERQYKIFLSDMTLLGNGVGSGTQVLLTEIKYYYTFDNAHFEFIYNLGLIPYLFLMFFIYRYLIFNFFNRFSACLMILITIFHSLNFNLFDPYFFVIWFLLASEALTENKNISSF